MLSSLLACGATVFAAPGGAGPTATAASPASAPASSPASPHSFAKKKPPAAAPKPLVDINSASVKQLKTLPGIGDAEAQRIVAGRPYRSKAELVTTKVLPAGNYLSIRRLIVAKPPGKPRGKV